jgi:hypothetical protein
VKNKEVLQRAKNDRNTLSTVPTRGEGGSRYKLQGPGSPEGARGPTMLHMFLSLSVVSDVIR